MKAGPLSDPFARGRPGWEGQFLEDLYNYCLSSFRIGGEHFLPLGKGIYKNWPELIFSMLSGMLVSRLNSFLGMDSVLHSLKH